MSYRKRMDWPPRVRSLLLDNVRRSHEDALAADTALKVRIYITVQQGLTTREIAEHTGLSQTTISKYRIAGEKAHRELHPTP